MKRSTGSGSKEIQELNRNSLESSFFYQCLSKTEIECHSIIQSFFVQLNVLRDQCDLSFTSTPSSIYTYTHTQKNSRLRCTPCGTVSLCVHTKDQTCINNVISLSASSDHQWVSFIDGTSGSSIIENKFTSHQ